MSDICQTPVMAVNGNIQMARDTHVNIRSQTAVKQVSAAPLVVDHRQGDVCAFDDIEHSAAAV
jgi:hypothetical protein